MLNLTSSGKPPIDPSLLPPDDPTAAAIDHSISPDRAAAIMRGKEIPCMLHYLANPFPPKLRPVWILNPGSKISYGANEDAYRQWVRFIDSIVHTRAVTHMRNGIIHTGSYDRVRKILTYTKYASIMITHDGGSRTDKLERAPGQQWLHYKTTEEAVAAYRQIAGLGYVLVSPRLTTGFSFPDDECRFNLIGKAPFPAMDDLVTLIRASIYGDFIPDQVAQIATQACGRGNRHQKDWCENFILDLAMIPYLGQKRGMLPPDMPIQYWSNPGLPPVLMPV